MFCIFKCFGLNEPYLILKPVLNNTLTPVNLYNVPHRISFKKLFHFSTVV